MLARCGDVLVPEPALHVAEVDPAPRATECRALRDSTTNLHSTPDHKLN